MLSNKLWTFQITLTWLDSFYFLYLAKKSLFQRPALPDEDRFRFLTWIFKILSSATSSSETELLHVMVVVLSLLNSYNKQCLEWALSLALLYHLRCFYKWCIIGNTVNLYDKSLARFTGLQFRSPQRHVLRQFKWIFASLKMSRTFAHTQYVTPHFMFYREQQ